MAQRDKVEPKTARANFPSSPECGQWETLLVDAMDGALRPEDEATFSNHMATCAACTEMFEQVRRGREWLEFLAPEPQVPPDLLARILAETANRKIEPGGGLIVAGAATAGANVVAMTPHWQRPGIAVLLRRFAEPRLLMTAAMAFFSIALTLSMTGVRFSAVRLSDLKPSVLRSNVEKRIMTASTPLVRYYDHLRFVYEVESRMKELRRATEATQQQNQKTGSESGSGSGGDGGQGESHRKDGGSDASPSQQAPAKQGPNSAPQQTVNPPQLWSGDSLEAAFHPPLQTSGPALRTALDNQKGGGTPTTTPIQPRRFAVAAQAEASVPIAPERSISCLA